MPKSDISLFGPAIHVVIWAILLTIPAIIFHNAPGSPSLPGAFFLFTNLYHIGLFYLNTLLLYPKLLTRRRWPLYLLSLGAVLVISYYGKLLLIRAWMPEVVLISFVRLLFFPPLLFLIASGAYSMVRDRLRLERLEKQREAERLAAELKFLRQQISPHFLFNMMTNMVSLARQGSPLLEPSLIKLSDLLRYSLYESGEEKIDLGKEVELMADYIDLQQLRFGEGVDLRFTVPDVIDAVLIEPMLLIPFVENAFKHGIGLVEAPFIEVGLEMRGCTLHFRVSNNYHRDHSGVGKSAGIGLVNIKSRLELLYPGRHSLTITDRNQIYTVALNLDLS